MSFSTPSKEALNARVLVYSLPLHSRANQTESRGPYLQKIGRSHLEFDEKWMNQQNDRE
jgi:hypothetical protein